MANFEVQIGADNSELNKKIKEAEFDLKELSNLKIEQIKLGLDTKELDANIKDVKKSLSDMKITLKDTGSTGFDTFQKGAQGGSNTLMQFSRIAQDAPFGIMGIGNNLTATAEAFSHLSKTSGGAGAALKAVGASLAGPGGILLAVSLVTTALTVMSQKGITVADVFNKLSGTFDQFKQDLKEVNKEAAKNAAEQVASVSSYVSAAKDINLSMQSRLIAVKKLQDEYPAFFGNLTKEQILNGNVANAVNGVVSALKAKARAQAYAGKLGDLAAKEVDLEEQRALIQDKFNKATAKTKDLLNQVYNNPASEQIANRWAAAGREAANLKDDLADVSGELRVVQKEMDKCAKKSTVETKASIKLEYEPPKVKKVKLPKQLHTQLDNVKVTPNLELEQIDRADPFAALTASMEASRAKFIERLQSMAGEIKTVLVNWNDVLGSGLSDIGTTIGDALANGGNVLAAVGTTLLNQIGALLSSVGDKLITVGVTAVLAGTALQTMFTPAGIAAGLAAIAGGVALKAGGSLLSANSKKMADSSKGMSAGNSVSSPTSSINNSGSQGGFQNVVFEISGQSLVGVLSNTLNRNVKLGGTPAI